MPDSMAEPADIKTGPNRAQNLMRTAEFWRRAAGIYLSYKSQQINAWRLRRQGWSSERLRDEVWQPHHTWAGEEFYQMAVDLRGFYLKLGQFFAARAEFVPMPICKSLARLHDQVPPMPVAQARKVLEGELGGVPVDDVFEWIDLDKPLGSASVAQVHKAKLKGTQAASRPPVWRRNIFALESAFAAPADSAPDAGSLEARRSSSSEASTSGSQPSSPAARAAQQALNSPSGPKNGIVAVKLQYPGSLPTMMTDLRHIRVFSAFLSKTEIKFDLVSAVDELAGQVRLEFDFQREAEVMDTVAHQLRGMRKQVEVPRSIPGLVTQRMLTMTFLEGTQITRLRNKIDSISKWKREHAKQRILERVTAAYGHMLLVDGLFQADAHPGNILVQPGGRIGLLDYGQSKQLPTRVRLSLARLILAMEPGTEAADSDLVAACVRDLGLRFEKTDNRLQAAMAAGMFDSRLSHKVDPFSENSPLKKMAISHFPPDAFFVLRVVQLLRGLAMGMQVQEHSTARQWAPFAREALKKAGQTRYPEIS